MLLRRKLELLFIFLLLLFCGLYFMLAGICHAQERKTYILPFHISKGLILLDAQLDGKPAVLMLDTGAQDSFVVKFDYPIAMHEHDGTLTFHTRRNPQDRLSLYYAEPDVNLDGVIGEDLLHYFRSMLIDYKAQTVTLEH